MKMPKAFLLLTILLASFPICFGQEKPEAVLVDEFRTMPCDEFLARLHGFSIDLTNNPTSTGYIVIYPDKISTRKTIPYVDWINAQLALSKFDESRYIIIQGEKRDEQKTEFWRIPPGAEENFYNGEKWVEPVRETNKAFVFKSVDADQICPSFNPREYAKILLSDSSLRGHIIIFNTPRKYRQEAAETWLTMLTEDYKVPRNRLRVFFAKNQNGPETEFWIVPTKKK